MLVLTGKNKVKAEKYGIFLEEVIRQIIHQKGRENHANDNYNG